MPTNIRLKVSTPPPIKLRYIEAVTKPEVERTVTPTYEGVVVTPPSGATLSKVTIEPIPDPTAEETYSANGDYNVSRIGTAHVRVPQGVFPTGTKQISITQNGTTTEDESEYANAEITANVPVGIVNGEFGKIDKQTIIAGENSIAGMEQMYQYIRSAISDSPHGNNGFCVASAQLKTQYNTAHEFLVMIIGGTINKAYRVEPNPLRLYECSINNAYLCTLVPGTKIDVYIPYFDFSDLPL